MVGINDIQEGKNEPSVKGYLRNLGEYRATVENSILPLISYFVDMTETKKGTILLPSGIFYDQKKYLEHLAKRYHKRDFDVRVDLSQEKLEAYNIMTKLIRTNKKAVQHSLCDFIDFIRDYPSLFEQVNIGYNLALAIHEETPQFHHKNSERLDELLAQHPAKEIKIEKNRKVTYPTLPKFKSPQHVYLFMLDHMKRAVDFEFLKLYDFLLENELEVIHSNKLKELEEELKRRGEGEYTKWPLSVNIQPQEDERVLSFDEHFIDEWSANIRRSIEAQEKTVKDFYNYMQTTEGKIAKQLYLSGAYPDLVSLLQNYFKGNVPQEFNLFPSRT